MAELTRMLNIIKSNKGINYATLTALVSGVSIFLNKFAVAVVKPPIYFTGTKNLAVGIMLLGFILVTRKWRLLLRLSSKELTILLSIAVIGGTIPFYLFFTGLATVSALTAGFLQKTLVIWIAFMAVSIFKEKMSMYHYLGIGLIIIGNFITVGTSSFVFSTGEWMILGSSFFWAIEYVIAKKALESLDPDLVSFFRLGIGSLLLLGAGYFSGAGYVINYSLESYLWLFLTAILLLVYVSLWYRALKFAPVITVAVILSLSTIVTSFLSAIFVSQSISTLVTAQNALVTAGAGVFMLAIYSASKDSSQVESVE